MKKQKEFEHFNLNKYFSVFNFIIIIVLTVVLSFMIIWSHKNALINYAVSTTEEFAHQLNQRIYSDFIFASLKKNSLLKMIEKGSSEHMKLDKIAGTYLYDYKDIFKFRMFDLSGRIIYSTDYRNMGDIFRSEILDEALKGNTASLLEKHGTGERNNSFRMENSHSIDILSIYVPIYKDIYNKSDEDIVGVFEIHRDVSSLFNVIKKEIYSVPLEVMLAMTVLFFFWQVIVKRADKIIRRQNVEIASYNAVLEEAQEKLISSIDQVMEYKSFNIRFQSDDLVKCWETKKCEEKDCPSHMSENLRCWQVSGTFCSGKAQGQFANKFGDCRKCEVYKHAFNEKINIIGESFNNMMTLLENKHRELEGLNEKLNRLVDIDPLTQTGNRRSFHKRMESIHMMALRYSHPYSIVVCDVDNFKLYNDTYGHQKGDYVLLSIAKAMKASVRKTDEIFRWGGEEFVIILPEQDSPSALRVAENIRESIELLKIEHTGNEPQSVTVSCGVSSNSAGHISWERILKSADDALYMAKQAGRNCVCSAPDTDYKT
jgi:diguanylate cyclase (GGDEF)-like protein